VARQLRRNGLVGRTVHLKVRTGDFTTWTRSETLREPTDLPEPLVRVARRLFDEHIRLRGRGVRLLGLGVSGLEPAGSRQPSLFGDPVETRARSLARAADTIRKRLGDGALTRARLIRRKKADSAGTPKKASSPPSVD
jgi:DNA polymerase-4